MAADFLRWLPCLLAGDLLLPFLLALPYRGYSHRRQVMSALGSPTAPLHAVYSAWLIALGVLLIAAAAVLEPIIAVQSAALSAALTAVLDLYAAGGCIAPGLFPVGAPGALGRLSGRIHVVGAAVGFVALLAAPLIIALYFFGCTRTGLGILSVLCFVGSVTFFVLFVLADKQRYRHSVIACAGLWQRLALLCMSLPLAVLCLDAAFRF